MRHYRFVTLLHRLTFTGSFSVAAEEMVLEDEEEEMMTPAEVLLQVQRTCGFVKDSRSVLRVIGPLFIAYCSDQWGSYP